MKVVFFGTPAFSVPCLELLHQHKSIEVAAVVSMPDRKAGRGNKFQTPPVAAFAKENDIPLIQTENINKDQQAFSKLESIGADFFLVIAFAQFLGKKVLNTPRLGCFNIHTSLLPKYRGAAPIQYALLNGDEETGVSIQKMVSKMDAGAIVYDHSVKIEPNETSKSLFEKLENEAAKGLSRFIPLLLEKRENLEERDQIESDASFAPTIKKEDGHINPFLFSATDLFNRYRAFHPWPGQYIFMNGQRLKVNEIELFPSPLKTGEVDISMGALTLGTKDGTVRLKTVQPEGKKAQTDKDFINGLKSRGVIPTLDKDQYD